MTTTTPPLSAVAPTLAPPSGVGAAPSPVTAPAATAADGGRTWWHSVSSTREYERCPRRYRYAYVDRLPQDRHVPPAWRIGSAVHAALEAAYRHRMAHPDAPTMAGLPAALVALRHAWDELELEHHDGSYPRAGQQVARTLGRDVLGRRTVLGVELALRDDIAPGHRIVGMLDLALRLGPTTVQIVDHKVTRWRSRPDQLAADLQLNLYGALVRLAWPDTTTVIATDPPLPHRPGGRVGAADRRGHGRRPAAGGRRGPHRARRRGPRTDARQPLRPLPVADAVSGRLTASCAAGSAVERLPSRPRPGVRPGSARTARTEPR